MCSQKESFSINLRTPYECNVGIAVVGPDMRFVGKAASDTVKCLSQSFQLT